MGKRFDCPVCGARTTLSRYERDGCWSCEAAEEKHEADGRFGAFMRLDEEERWRRLWELAGSPEPY